MNSLLNILVAASSLSSTPSVSSEEGLERLKAGNRRFVSQTMDHPRLDAKVRQETSKAQHPFAAILTCADSRVSPEFVFDQGIGDLFVIRTAGNVVDEDTLASLEYAVDHLGVGLIVVMGHSKCGAVSAAVAETIHQAHGNGEPEAYVPKLIEKIKPAVRYALTEPGDLFAHSVHTNEQMVSTTIRKAGGGLARAFAEHRLAVVGAVYDIESNRVDIDPVYAWQNVVAQTSPHPIVRKVKHVALARRSRSSSRHH